LVLIIACINQREESKEITFIDDAVKKAKTENKILIIEFWTPECGPSNPNQTLPGSFLFPSNPFKSKVLSGIICHFVPHDPIREIR